MQALLSFDQSPPLAAPLRFFLTAPLFAVAAGFVIIVSGPDAMVSRWTPAVLALTHLLAAGFMLQVMLGALLQILPVVAGANMRRPLRVAAGVLRPRRPRRAGLRRRRTHRPRDRTARERRARPLTARHPTPPPRAGRRRPASTRCRAGSHGTAAGRGSAPRSLRARGAAGTTASCRSTPSVSSPGQWMPRPPHPPGHRGIARTRATARRGRRRRRRTRPLQRRATAAAETS